ncbi:ribonuclease P protein component [Nocardioides sambongensis]|uniref:ribonuclease P protein component n=1 Tax=Nocardioides sambongensis TaxID=2589074 RepID=UPI00112665C9|nr:ribonuclease P protein component [Nocardioides sambongensis]
MLPVAARLTEADLFRRVARTGRRSGSATLVTHLLTRQGEEALVLSGAAATPRVGFVVSKAVGGAVVRNQVKRRLRHLVRERLDLLPGGSVLVVRATPASAAASYDELHRDLDRCLSRVCA